MLAEPQLCFAALDQNTAGIFPYHLNSDGKKKQTKTKHRDKAGRVDNKSDVWMTLHEASL